jgi:hypothetical protein
LTVTLKDVENRALWSLGLDPALPQLQHARRIGQ